MKAVLIATGESAGFRFLSDRYPTGLLPLAGKPLLFHIVEQIVQAGVREFDLVLSHLPGAVEILLGDGSRWGANFRYHLTPDPARPYRALPLIAGSGNSAFLLAREDFLPELAELPATNVVWCDGSRNWTGWAVLDPADLAQLPTEEDSARFAQALLQRAEYRGEIAKAERLLSIATPECYLESQAAMLAGRGPSALLLSGNEASPGIRISRNVSIHPTARIETPAYIGANCRIGAGAHIGPNASVGENCLVDARARIEHSAVFAGSYVGESLELDHVLVDHNRLVNLRLDTEVTLTDAFLLGRLNETGIRRLVAGISRRALAAALLVLTSPVLLLTMLVLKLCRKGPVVFYREAVWLPAQGRPEQWRTFRILSFRRFVPHRRRSVLLEVLPGLATVIGGKLSLVGLEARGREEILALPPDWRSLYLGSKAGLITEASLSFPASDGPDAIFAAEAYYTAVAGFSHDLRLLCTFVGQMAAGSPESSMEAPVE